MVPSVVRKYRTQGGGESDADIAPWWITEKFNNVKTSAAAQINHPTFCYDIPPSAESIESREVVNLMHTLLSWWIFEKFNHVKTSPAARINQPTSC